MQEWFTIEEIDAHTFAISEYQHWEKAHSYLIVGSEKAILLDTGMGIGNIKVVVDAMTNLPIEVITTHAHWDHIGGHGDFEKVGIHEVESSWLREFPLPLAVVKQNLLREPCAFPSDFNIEEYRVPQVQNVIVLQDNEEIDLGNRQLKIIHTPGRSPGHICLYEEETGYLFSGDLIYKGKLDMFYPTTNPVDFMNSINKVSKLEVTKILPGHYDLEIDTHIIEEIQQAFEDIESSGKLQQGEGVLNYEHFSIHL